MSRERGRDQYEDDIPPYRRNNNRSGSVSQSTSPGRRPNSRDPSPFGRPNEELTEEEKQQYAELLDHFGGDEEALRAAIEDFMEEYSRDPEKFETLMREEEAAEMTRQSRSPSPGRR